MGQAKGLLFRFASLMYAGTAELTAHDGCPANSTVPT